MVNFWLNVRENLPKWKTSIKFLVHQLGWDFARCYFYISQSRSLADITFWPYSKTKKFVFNAKIDVTCHICNSLLHELMPCPCTIIQKVNRFSAMLQQGVTFCFIDIHLHVKFQKKLMSSLRRSLEADGHTRSITMDYYYGLDI